MRIGQARLTAGLDRFASIGLREHEEIFGSLRRLATSQLIDLAESVDLRGRGGAAFPFGHFFFSIRRRHTRWNCDWSSDVCSSDLSATPRRSSNRLPRKRRKCFAGFQFPNRDRKSTRLNSSHSSISYAVFCLKK